MCTVCPVSKYLRPRFHHKLVNRLGCVVHSFFCHVLQRGFVESVEVSISYNRIETTSYWNNNILEECIH